MGACDPRLGLVGGMPSAETQFLPPLLASLVRSRAAGASFAQHRVKASIGRGFCDLFSCNPSLEVIFLARSSSAGV